MVLRAITQLIAGVLVCGLLTAAGEGGASEQRGVSDAPPMTIWHIPHPDDETLGMAGAIATAARQSRNHLVVLYTDGRGSDVRHVINGTLYCFLHGRFHDPHEEGYEPLTADDFARARMRETQAALAHLGIEPDQIMSAGLTDGHVQVQDAYRIMVQLDKEFPDAAHRTVSLRDPHRDHRNLARALHWLIQDKRAMGQELDAGFYGVYPYREPIERRGTALVKERVADMEQKRTALAEFGVWQPEAGRFAIGMHSVPRLFDNAAADVHEYRDPPDSTYGRGLPGYDVSVHLFADEVGFAFAFTPRFSWRVAAAPQRGAIITVFSLHAATFTRTVGVFAGWGVRLSHHESGTFGLAGTEMFDRVVLEFRTSVSDPRNIHFRAGWKMDL